MNREFQIGDRVICVAPDRSIGTSGNFEGNAGTIIDVPPCETYMGFPVFHVEYDERFCRVLHNCSGRINTRKGWLHFAHELDFIDKTVIEVNDLL